MQLADGKCENSYIKLLSLTIKILSCTGQFVTQYEKISCWEQKTEITFLAQGYCS